MSSVMVARQIQFQLICPKNIVPDVLVFIYVLSGKSLLVPCIFIYVFFLELKLPPSVLTEARGFCRSCKYILELVSQNLVGEHVIARKDKLDLFGPQKLPVLKPVSLTQSTRASTRKQKMKRGFIFQPHRESKDPCKSTES